MKQVIIAISGRKSAGKNTIAKFIASYYTKITDQKDASIECSFADTLKEFCIETLGLSYEQCYGTDDEKNSPTQYAWENIESYLRWKFGSRQMRYHNRIVDDARSMVGRQDFYYDISSGHDPVVGQKTGKMTGREIMQVFGTDLIRENFGNVWAAATVRKIKRHNKPLSTIVDCRFPNEIDTIMKEPGGFVVRLTRSPFGLADKHPSEASLDDFKWNHPKCFVLDNKHMTIEEQNQAIIPILDKIIGGQNELS